ncbi:hypothetical protein [Acinetobacter lactucae]|uniref:Uncharacterized protein n=1 Tax=Acinetobacter lactucae TaxID=1785128 RepID=R8YVU0_9GAMM|nr:hypothetical protein [Acinetobacter lactucae]EOQ73515.1 hypothetical protein F929_03458 [Acinetobacter lactucae]
MDNYKIKVKDEAESKEAQELFAQLGYELDTFFGNYEPNTKWVLACKDGSMGCASDGMAKETLKELSLPQLRDLVVLKRNDVKDATHEHKQFPEFKYLHTGDNRYAWMVDSKTWEESDCDHAWHVAHTQPVQTATQDQGLISGAEALRALADGKSVEASTEFSPTVWEDAANYSANEFLAEETAETEDYCSMKLFFRLKPQTIKLDLEIPAPFKAKIGGRDDTSFILNVGRHQYLYQNEDDYTKARNALEAVFDAALGGYNS